MAYQPGWLKYNDKKGLHIVETKLILKDRLSKTQILDFSDIVPTISKEEADDFIKNFHEQNPGMHFAVSVVSSLILIHHVDVDTDDVGKTAKSLTNGIAVLMVAFPDIFNEPIEYSFHNGHQIEMHPGGPLDKHLAYEALEDKLNWRN